MEEEKKGPREDLEKLREMTERLEGGIEEEEAVEILERAVEETEELGRRLEEGEE